MPTVELTPVDKDNWRAVTKLKVKDDQSAWVAPNWYSIIEAIFEDGEIESLAILADGEIVGYMMAEVDTGKDRALKIHRLMVAPAHQGKGIGRAALNALLDRYRDHADIDRSLISFVPGNDGAAHLYRRVGFVDTGQIHDGEHVYELRFDETEA